MRTGLRIGVGVLAAAGVAAVLTVCAGRGTTTSAGPPGPAVETTAAAAVTTGRPERQTVRQRVEQPGQIEGFEEAPVYARVAAYVRAVRVDIGDRVKAGAVLAELAVPEMEKELHQKEAAVSLAKAEIAHARRALQGAEAGLHKAEAQAAQAEAGRTRAEAGYRHWRTEYERAQRLLPRHVVDEQEHERALDQFKSAEAARDESAASIRVAAAAREESQAQRDQAESNVRVAEAKLEVAEADRQHTATLLEYATLRAPFDGVVTRRQTDVGRFVQPAQGSDAKGPPLFVVVRTDPVRIFVDVPEAAAGFVREGTPARVRVQALADEEFEGRVARTSWQLDARTRTLRTEIDLPNPAGRLRPGMYAAAVLTVERPGALTLPAAAVLNPDGQPLVVLVQDGKAVRVPVSLGTRLGQRVEVLRKQVAPARPDAPAAWEAFGGTEEVVLTNASAVTDGQAVRTDGPAADGRIAEAR
jgi:multidrug efflux pump subunit AcrA (membrane-fusion protein)